MREPVLDLRDLMLSQAASDECWIFAMDTSFSAVPLHDRSSRCWAVVGDDSGAIARRPDGRLLMRMREAEAHALATALTVEARRLPTLH